jgi:hypothetical protein
MKKINSKEIENINGGGCLVWAVVSGIGWVGMLFFAPLAWLGVIGAGAYVTCIQFDASGGGDGPVNNQPNYQ